MDKDVSRNKVKNTLEAEKSALTAMCKWHMGSRWYTSDLHMVTIDI